VRAARAHVPARKRDRFNAISRQLRRRRIDRRRAAAVVTIATHLLIRAGYFYTQSAELRLAKCVIIYGYQLYILHYRFLCVSCEIEQQLINLSLNNAYVHLCSL